MLNALASRFETFCIPVVYAVCDRMNCAQTVALIPDFYETAHKLFIGHVIKVLTGGKSSCCSFAGNTIAQLSLSVLRTSCTQHTRFAFLCHGKAMLAGRRTAFRPNCLRVLENSIIPVTMEPPVTGETETGCYAARLQQSQAAPVYYAWIIVRQFTPEQAGILRLGLKNSTADTTSDVRHGHANRFRLFM